MTDSIGSRRRRRLRAVLLSIAMVVSVVTTATPAAAAGQTQLAVQPGEVQLSAGETTTVDVVVTNADGGVGAVGVHLALTNPSVASIESVSVKGDPGQQQIDVTASGASATVSAALMDTGDTGAVTVLTVTLHGESSGQTGLKLSLAEGSSGGLGDELGAAYDVTATPDATVTVGNGHDADDGTGAGDGQNSGNAQNPGNGQGNGPPGQRELAASVSVKHDGPLAANEPAVFKLDGAGPIDGDASVTVVGPGGTTILERSIPVVFRHPTTVVWRPTDELPSGNYTVELTVSDGSESLTRTATVTVDTAAPAVSVDGVSSPSGATAGVDGLLSVGDTLTVSGQSGTDATEVTVVLSARFTSFRRTITVQRTADWLAQVNTDSLPDDGAYTVKVRARDAAGNVNQSTAETAIEVDRRPPTISATMHQTGPDTAQVVVTSDEPLAAAPTVTLRRPGGKTEQVTLTRDGTNRWTTTVSTVTSGSYHIKVVGTDVAGNTGHGAANAEVRTNIQVGDDGNVTIVSDSGSFVDLEVNGSVRDAYAVVTTSSAFANLSDSFTGVGFLTGELAENLSVELDSAVVGIPVNESRLDQLGVDAADVSLRHFNDTTGAWERVGDTRVVNQTVNGTERRYFLVNVTHFSTYGAVVADDTAPTLQSATPDGETFAYDTQNVSATVDYADDGSGVDPTRVRVFVDGVNVTESVRTSITSDAVTYEATGAALDESLVGSGHHVVRVVAVDEAGNSREFTTSFTVRQDTAAPEVTSVSPTNGTTVQRGVVTFELATNDDLSGLDPAAVSATLDGQSVPVRIEDGTITYAANLSAGTHTFAVTVVDEARNSRTREVTITVPSVDDQQTGSGGGGGGGGGQADESATLSLSLTDTAAGATISVRDPAMGTSGTAKLGSFVAANDVTVQSIEVTMEFDANDYRIEVDDPTTKPPEAAKKLADAVAYLPIESIGARAYTFKSMIVRVRVNSAALPAGASPADVVLYRFVKGSWKEIDTKHVGDGVYVVQMEAPSSLAIRVKSTTPTGTSTSASTTPTATSSASPTPAATTHGTSAAPTEKRSPGFGPVKVGLALVALLLARRRLRR